MKKVNLRNCLFIGIGLGIIYGIICLLINFFISPVPLLLGVCVVVGTGIFGFGGAYIIYAVECAADNTARFIVHSLYQ